MEPVGKSAPYHDIQIEVVHVLGPREVRVVGRARVWKCNGVSGHNHSESMVISKVQG